MKYLALIALLASPAFADTVTYQSQTLAGTASVIDGDNTQNSPINDVFTVTVTISGPLAPNLNMALVTPQSWTVVCQNCAQDLSSDPPNPTTTLIYTAATAAVFLFSTDSTGKITAWNFALSGDSILSDGAGDISKSSSGSFSSGDIDTSLQILGNHEYIVATSGPKGTWTQSSLAVTQAPAAPTAPQRQAQKYSPQVRLWFGRL